MGARSRLRRATQAVKPVRLFDGLTLREHSAASGIPYETLVSRVRTHGEPFPKSLRSLSTLPLAVGSVIGRLTIAAAAPKGERGIERVAIKCICGVQKIMNGATICIAVKRGIQPSCGCGRIDANAEHIRAVGKRAAEWSTGKVVTPIRPGRVFERLTVRERAPKPEGQKGRASYWLCDCACGQSITTRGDSLLQARTTSCGCKSPSSAHASSHIKRTKPANDLTGRVFGRLRVVPRAGKHMKQP